MKKETLDRLVQSREAINLTLTLPTFKKGEEVQQNPIRFKNLLNEAESELEQAGCSKQEVEQWLREPRQQLGDLHFWNHTDRGLVLYLNESTYEIFQLPYDLPEQVYVQDHFLITPLIPMVSLSGSWSMLAISPKNLRLIRCTRDEVFNITPNDIFTSMENFLDKKPEAHLQFHTGTSGKEAMFFGHGGKDEDGKAVLRKYLHGVEESVTRTLNQSGEPLLLAGTEEVAAIYRSMNKYGRLLDPVVTGSTDERSDQELRDAGWSWIQDQFLKEMHQSLSKLDKADGDRFTNHLGTIIESTVMGRTDTLFLAMGEQAWGEYDVEANTVHYRNGDHRGATELMNWTAIQAMEKGARVYVLPKEEMPDAASALALFRF
ncbi:MAG: hypothetical protein ACQER4_07180 [Bacteroidota bacterium]